MLLTASVERVCAGVPWCDPDIIRATVQLACEIVAEGHEGSPVGALFTIGRAEAVLAASRPLILDPLHGHAAAARHITDRRLRATVKQLSRLDGAFVIADDGCVVGACRYLMTSGEGIEVPMGLGCRHLAAASVSKDLHLLAIVVSQSGIIRVYHAGDLLTEFRLPNE